MDELVIIAIEKHDFGIIENDIECLVMYEIQLLRYFCWAHQHLFKFPMWKTVNNWINKCDRILYEFMDDGKSIKVK